MDHYFFDLYQYLEVHLEAELKEDLEAWLQKVQALDSTKIQKER